MPTAYRCLFHGNRQQIPRPWKPTSQAHLFTEYPKKYAHGCVVLCFVLVMKSFIMNSHEVFIHIHQGCFAGTGAIVRLPQCQWSKPYGYGKISQCITTTKHSKAKTVCLFLGIYCMMWHCIFHYLGRKQLAVMNMSTMLSIIQMHSLSLTILIANYKTNAKQASTSSRMNL